MPGYRLFRALPLLILPLWAVCAATASHGDEPGAASRRNCGFEAALQDYYARSRTRSDDWGSRPARACGPPDAEEIASACEVKEAVPTGLEHDSNLPDYDMPEYRVRGARCRLVDRGRSEAHCRFELGDAGPAPAWRKVRMRFRYRFGIGSDDQGHPFEWAMWDAGGVCAAGEAPAAH